MSDIKKECYILLSLIPKGKITTYKILANALSTNAYRYIGQLMKKNPNPIKVPCHRIVCSDGSIGGYLYGQKKKIELLKNEGVEVYNYKVVDFKKNLYFFNFWV
jgi:methylated-DNA-[protein]-cysteine S-methyltransferase